MKFHKPKHIFFCLLILLSLPLISYAKIIKGVKIVMPDNKEVLIPVLQGIDIFQEESGFLKIESQNMKYELPITDILRFELVLTIDDSGIEGMNSSLPWLIYDTNGRLLKQGYGSPDINSLSSGYIYIIKQGDYSFKIFK